MLQHISTRFAKPREIGAAAVDDSRECEGKPDQQHRDEQALAQPLQQWRLRGLLDPT